MSGTIWHDVECGAYSADLRLWRELASRAGGRVLELGAGTGRVALDLARAGHPVTALERDPALLEELRRRSDHEGLGIETIEGDARCFSVDGRFALVVAPMQLTQLFDTRERESLLASVAAHLAPTGLAALALASGEGIEAEEEQPHLLPDVREVDGWIYSSLPIGLRLDNGAIEIRRLRQTVSPAGELSEELDLTRLHALEPAELEADADRAGLHAAGRREIPPTDDHTGSVVVLLDMPR